MKKIILPVLAATLISGCGSVALMTKTSELKAQPEMLIKTDGDFWGLGQEGSFDIAGKYTGKYDRSSSGSTWFNTVSTTEGDMVAEITRTDNGDTWVLVCSGGGTSVNIGGLSFGGNDPYRCDISVDSKTVGEYEMKSSSAAISLDVAKYESGVVRINNEHLNVKSVHKSDDLFMTVENPLGYVFEQGTQSIAAVQTNGLLSLQTLPDLSADKQDLIVVGSIASALSWRPE
ncbi:hypothetical protein [Moritella sp. Urea-trap-13]|uniref:hypothetical protein n=1 Tax=Moritella sp. Urea-trap-13 TaxID=2058327 RepID=UPI000C3420FE|nr:hypothetical protein [Moritella sp. Urea-trap-13]PKH07002.1 hypothetical protein CXF93_14080 [Moritella sp. Urea-trap-13]